MFLKVATKKVLVHVDMMGSDFYTVKELEDVAQLPEFWGWNETGYYRQVEKCYINDSTAEDVASTPNRSVDDVGCWEDYFCFWLEPYEIRVMR